MEKLQRMQGKTNNWPTVDFPPAKEGEAQKYHGWFSQKHLDMNWQFNLSKKSRGSFIYLNENGEEIEVTEVSTSASPSMRFDDIKYKGVMVKWVRTVDK
jgi:hypothetical protein